MTIAEEQSIQNQADEDIRLIREKFPKSHEKVITMMVAVGTICQNLTKDEAAEVLRIATRNNNEF